MTNQPRNSARSLHFGRLAPLAAAVALLATACGSTTTASSPSDTARSDAAPTARTDATTALPATDAPPVTDATTPRTPCGDFGHIPPVPDSMATQFVATNVEGCVELVGTDSRPDPEPVDDLVLTTPTIPVPTRPVPPVTIDPVLVAPAPPAPCGVFDPIPATSQITSDLTVDLVGDGVADDQVITYLDGSYKLRSIRNGVISEVVVPDVGVSSIRALGVGDAGEISAGNEIIVRTGGGASAAEIGIFGHDAAGCVFQFTLNGADLEMYVGATIGTSSGMYCGDGIIAQWHYELDDDGTYFGSSAAYFESSAGDFTYLPVSDDFSEGLALEDLSPAELDCFGFGL